ncbi:FAD-dependent oxidoreductase [Microlunatus elymi]|uniref:FAD-dependent oxidoreductase n=1 Tax=Microlunatus elymi TaxID=2596828 RepID=A0A516PXJ1_9ACTN|nr:FAD-dependent oxidoreductase [Microlunatus elymi]
MSDQEVVVVGGGIAGASTAFGLARRGVAVTIVDDGATPVPTVGTRPGSDLGHRWRPGGRPDSA